LAYKLRWNSGAYKDLKALDKSTAARIVSKVKTVLIHNPLERGKPLTGPFKGFYRYRVGHYRVIYTVDEQTITIIVLRVRHRKDVYRRVM
jgi:mRNA interferase RelE/StbE